jgi:hypothetical protein
VNFLRDSNPRWSPLQLTEVSIGKEMICQMLFNNNIVHESLKSDSDEQYRLFRLLCWEDNSQNPYFFKTKNMNILKNNVHSSCVWKLMKSFTCRIINPKSLKYLFFNHFNFCINKTQFSKQGSRWRAIRVKKSPCGCSLRFVLVPKEKWKSPCNFTKSLC